MKHSGGLGKTILPHLFNSKKTFIIIFKPQTKPKQAIYHRLPKQIQRFEKRILIKPLPKGGVSQTDYHLLFHHIPKHYETQGVCAKPFITTTSLNPIPAKGFV